MCSILIDASEEAIPSVDGQTIIQVMIDSVDRPELELADGGVLVDDRLLLGDFRIGHLGIEWRVSGKFRDEDHHALTTIAHEFAASSTVCFGGVSPTETMLFRIPFDHPFAAACAFARWREQLADPSLSADDRSILSSALDALDVGVPLSDILA